MTDSTPDSELIDAVPLVFEVASRLEDAEEAYRRLVDLVGEFSGVTVDELATNLNISRRHAGLIVQGAPFNEFLADPDVGLTEDNSEDPARA